MDRLRGNSGDSGRTSGNNSSQESDAYRQVRRCFFLPSTVTLAGPFWRNGCTFMILHYLWSKQDIHVCQVWGVEWKRLIVVLAISVIWLAELTFNFESAQKEVERTRKKNRKEEQRRLWVSEPPALHSSKFYTSWSRMCALSWFDSSTLIIWFYKVMYSCTHEVADVVTSGRATPEGGIFYGDDKNGWTISSALFAWREYTLKFFAACARTYTCRVTLLKLVSTPL